MGNKKSLIFAIEEIAILLRKKVKSARAPVKKPASGFSNMIEQVAQLIRHALQTARPKKKRASSPVKKRK